MDYTAELKCAINFVFFLYLFEDGGKPNWTEINLVAKIEFEKLLF